MGFEDWDLDVIWNDYMSHVVGTLYGIGVGPGDPDLVTLKAIRVLRRVPIVLMPYSVNHSSVALSIVHRWVRPTRQHITYQPYPMMGDEASLELAREEVAGQAIAFLNNEKDVAFVTEGKILPLLRQEPRDEIAEEVSS